MARKHSKQGIIKQDVERTLISGESIERKIVLNPETGNVELQHTEIPAVFKRGRAQGPTTKRGKKNGVTA